MTLVRAATKTMLIEAQPLALPLTNLTLHKLLYLAHGLMLARHARPLVDQHFQAWKYGPVLESLYHDLKPFGSSPVLPDSWFVSTWQALPPMAEDERQAIQSILVQFGDKPATTLIEISHDPDGPWMAVYAAANSSTITIDDEQIRHYFRKHLKDLQE